ncbi:hypothetical protein [Pontibacter sp. H249]|uniref:hypothetical protein n=1 Tax=Pontibacter sp. H249 TaxID=3133420 RepID=UPI0030BA5F2B
MIPFSHAWPLVWPGFAGIFLLMLLKNKGKLKYFSYTLKSLFKTSSLSAVIFFVFTLAVLYVIGFPEMNKVSDLLGAVGPIIINSSLIFGLLLASGLGIITAMISGSILYPFIRNR